MKICGAVLAVAMIGCCAAANAQNNTGYPSGTNCQDLQEPRRSACRDAFDPRPNARELINQPQQKLLLPPVPRRLKHSGLPSDPKSRSNVTVPRRIVPTQ